MSTMGMLTNFEYNGHKFSVSYVYGSYVATVAQINKDWADIRSFSKSFGNGIAAEEQLIKWMDNPAKILKHSLSRNEAIAAGHIRLK